jgi:zinc protease
VVPFFESLGLTFGRHQNAFTSFDQTTFQLEMPDNKLETLVKGFSFFSDVAFNLTLSPKEIDSERQIILEEKRSRLGAQQRVQEKLFKELAPGSIFGDRTPIGVEETILGVQQGDFKDYYGKWYVASNMTTIVVADIDPAVVVEQIKKSFSGGRKAERPQPQDVGIKPYTEDRAIVITDDELRDGSVGIVRLDKARPATTTEPLMRRDLIDAIGTFAFNRRLGAKVDAGKASFLSGYAFASDLFSAMHLAQGQARGEPGKWREMLREMAAELHGAKAFGFTDQEIADAKKELMAGAEYAVKTEPTRPATTILGGINSSIAQGEPYMSAQQSLDLTKKLLPGISTSEVTKSFDEAFDLSAVTFVVTLPTGVTGGVPGRDEVLKLGLEALASKVEKAEDAARPTELMATKPAAGKIVESSTHEASKVTSVWLDNNVRVSYRFMDYKKDQVSVTINVAGGLIEETPESFGLTEAASLAFEKPATGKLTSTNIRDLMTGKTVSVSGGAGGDSLMVTVAGSPAELEYGLQLAYLLLTDAKIEQAAFDQWKTATAQQIEARKLSPQGAFQELVADSLLVKGEVRTRPLEKENLDAITIDHAQKWLTRILSTGPIEVSVVGDIGQDRAMELVSTYLGSLAKRERVSENTLLKLREIDRPRTAVVRSEETKTKTPMGIVLGGFWACDAKDIVNVRRMNAAAQVLSTRMIKKLREEDQLVYSIGAQLAPNPTFKDWTLFLAAAPTEPSKAAKLGDRIQEMYAEFAASGPTDDEMVVAKKQAANTFDEEMKEPDYWSSVLRSMTYHGRALDEVLNRPAAYDALTAAEVKEAFAKYYKPESIIRLSMVPAAADGASKGEVPPAAK